MTTYTRKKKTQVEILKDVKKALNTEFCVIDAVKNQIIFTVQDGPIKEKGINGCQIDDIGKVWLGILQGFNEEYPCMENRMTITKIQEALMWQEARTKDRTKRNVEGLNKV